MHWKNALQLISTCCKCFATRCNYFWMRWQCFVMHWQRSSTCWTTHCKLHKCVAFNNKSFWLSHTLQSSNQRGVTAWLWMSFQNLTQVTRTQRKTIFSPSGISRSKEGQLFSQANINLTHNISLSNGNFYRNSLTFQPSGARSGSELRDVNSQGGFFPSHCVWFVLK